jgi:iron(III) transport system substrate-binding protein
VGILVAGLVAGCSTPSAATPTTAAKPTTAVQPTTAPVATTAAASTAQPAASDVRLTFYNAQHEDLITAMVQGFTRETGIAVDIRSGKDFELANQIVQEGASSPADAFVTENSPAMQIVDSKGLFAPVDQATRAQVPDRFSSSTGNWIGVAARATVLVYNPSLLPESGLPASIMDLSKPEWKGKVGFAPTGADFQAIVSAVVSVKGTSATGEWLRGLKANGNVYSGNGAVLRAVNAGEVPAGIIYHYYWYKDQAESGANSSNTQLYFFPNKDPGGFVSVSGLGALKSSKHPKEAQMLLQYLTGPHGQQVLADSTALEYTVNPAVAPNARLKPFAALSIPDVDNGHLNGPEVIDLMQQAGLL